MPPSALLEHDFFNTYIKSGIYASSSVQECFSDWCVHELHKPPTASISGHSISTGQGILTRNLGNILMISEGRLGSDNVFTLRNGAFLPKLRLEDSCHRRTES